MTICIACKVTKADGTVITRSASDSEVSFGNKRLRGISKSCEKIIQFPGASIAASGSGCVFETLLKLKGDKKYAKTVQFRNREDVVDFAGNFFALFDELVSSSNISKEDASIGVILVTTATQIFAIFQDFSVFEFDEWFCSGSGADTATGLMTAYYKKLGANPSEEELEQVLIEAITDTCEIEQGCGLPVKMYLTLAPNPPIKRRKKRIDKEEPPVVE
jgi:ATP-dependent protease HslVU (ClpYQ) peptidase subunit